MDHLHYMIEEELNETWSIIPNTEDGLNFPELDSMLHSLAVVKGTSIANLKHREKRFASTLAILAGLT